jgi:hypothetical protein
MKKPKGRNDMKKTSMKRTQQEEPTDIEQMCQELGDDAIKSMHQAYRLTAAAILRSAEKRAEAELKLADQYRTL